MAGLRPRFEKGPITFRTTSIANGGNVIGGRFVEYDGTTLVDGEVRIKPVGTQDAQTCIGLAIGDAAAYDFANADTTDTWGNTVVNAQNPPNEVAVAYQGVWDVVVAAGSATINPGDLVSVGAGALVKKFTLAAAGAASNNAAIVGRSVDKAPRAAGAKCRIRLSII